MSDAPELLTDDDFAEDAPPGYLSQKDKERYIPLMATLLGGTFVLQMIVPFVIMMIMMPMMMFGTMATANLPQYVKMTAWRDELWYPTFDGPGGGRGGSKLTALDYAGKPLDKPAIELDAQPEWLIADGERLWAVSRNDVTEIYADGSRPVTMHPTRYLHHAATPFLYQGQLAVVDWDETEVVQLCVFANGEWNASEELAIPDFTADPSAKDAPADALLPGNEPPPEEEAEIALQKALQAGPGAGVALGTAEDVVRVVIAAGIPHIVLEQEGRLYHHSGLPLKDGGEAESTGWTPLEVKPADWTLTTIEDSPSLLVQTNRPLPTLQLWRLTSDEWQQVDSMDTLAGGRGSGLAAFTTPDGSRTFAVIETMGILAQELVELKSDEIATVTELQNMMGFANPMSPDYLKVQFWAQLPTYLLMLTMVLGATWLMKKHRDPNYYCKREAVAYASLLRRGVAVLIDGAIIWWPVAFAWYWWYSHSDMSFTKFMRMMDAGPNVVLDYLLGLLPGFLATVGWFLFWAVTQWLLVSFYGCTVGKFFCGVRVARTGLQTPGLLRALVRMLMGVLETTVGIVLPIALIAFLQNRQRLADLVAGTVVVKSGSLRQARAALATQAIHSERGA